MRKPSQQELRSLGIVRNLLADFRIQNCLVGVDDCESATGAEWQSECAEVPADLNVPGETARAWETESAQAPVLLDSTTEYLARGFLKHSAWSDKLADYYANSHRSAFVLNYGFGVLAVFFAVLAFCCWQYPWTSKGLVFAELVSLIIIVAWWARSRRRQWHDRWIIIACSLSCCVCSVSRATWWISTPARRGPHQSYGDPRHLGLLAFQGRRRAAAGMPSAKVDAAYLRAYRRFVWKKLVIDQWQYHQESVKRRLSRLLRRIHLLSFLLLLAVLVACVVHLASGGKNVPGLKDAVILVIAAVARRSRGLSRHQRSS